MESYLDYSLALLPLLGVNLFDVVDEPPGQHAAPSTNSPLGDFREKLLASERQDARPLLYLKTPLTEAQGRDESRGFVVYEGAKARREKKLMTLSYEQLRDRLVVEGTLKPDGDQQYLLTKNFVFDSPSAAASVLSGGSKNGRTEWRTADGKTLKDLQLLAVQSEIPSEEAL